MQIPFFTLANYTNIMNMSYEDALGQEWISFRDIIDLRQDSFIDRFSAVDARQLSAYISEHTLQEPRPIGADTKTLAEVFIASKLLSPTHHACTYFFRDRQQGSHRGIDMMLPRGTPIMSFTSGNVVRIKHRDGNSNNEGNCVVVQTPDNHYICYEHLETIDVQLHQAVTQQTRIGRCGSTGNSTQYHLHLQIDTSLAPFHPYRHADAIHMNTYTVDPICYLRNRNPNSPFQDLPLQAEQQEAILYLAGEGIVKGFEGNCFPDNFLERYEMALLIDRVLMQKDMYSGLPIQQELFTPYQDTTGDDPELGDSLRRLQKYGIMKGNGTHFFPHQHLKGEELLALLGRIFFNLQDSSSGNRRQPYQDTFVEELLIASNRGYIRQAIPRKEVFLLLWKMLKK